MSFMGNLGAAQYQSTLAAQNQQQQQLGALQLQQAQQAVIAEKQRQQFIGEESKKISTLMQSGAPDMKQAEIWGTAAADADKRGMPDVADSYRKRQQEAMKIGQEKAILQKEETQQVRNDAATAVENAWITQNPEDKASAELSAKKAGFPPPPWDDPKALEQYRKSVKLQTIGASEFQKQERQLALDAQKKIDEDARNKRLDIQDKVSMATLARLQQGIAGADEDMLRFNAEQYLAGDSSVMTGMGRNPALLAKQRKMIQVVAKEQGKSPSDVAMAVAEFGGIKAEQRAVGTRLAAITVAATEAKKVIPIALKTSEAFDRTEFVPLNSAIKMAESNLGGTKVSKFVAANNAVINTYARAINPSGVPTVADKEHAREVLNTAQTKDQYKAVLDILQQEINAALASPAEVREGLRGGKPTVSNSGVDHKNPLLQ